jgi:serine/threonine-protein kinase
MTEVAENTLVDGRYRVRDRIGSGGMADVYEAEDTHLGRDVAIKLLHRRFSRDNQFVERFRREASAAARLQHPHVVSVYDRGEHDGTYYIAMERLEGRTLKDLIVEEAPIDQQRVVALGLQIVEAAHFAHEHGVIHRDLKPHNVIVGTDDELKVTDFGIARAGASEMTETGSIMGTAQYLSPEQAEGHAVTASSDVYSTGIVLYEMLTGRVPFEAESAVTIALKHLTEPPEPPSTFRPEVNPALEAVVMRALAKDPADRYESAADLAADLRAARERIVAGEDGRGTVLPAGAIVPVAGAIAYGPAPLADEEDERRRRRWPWLVLGLLAVALLGVGLAALLFTAQAQVPRVVGQDVDRATATIKRAGFRVRVEARTDRAPEGRILAQRPSPGREADEGSTVTLVASTGPAERTIPTVMGERERAAVRELTEASFRVETEERSSADVASGRAIGTRPPAGTEVEVGERVRLLISSGPREVEVPRVVGLTRSSAESALEAAGLGVNVEPTRSEEPADEVLAQSPDGGATVQEGAAVSIEVSTGPDEREPTRDRDRSQPGQDADTRTTVPGVVGLSPGAASSRLRAAGFGVARTTRRVGDEDRDGVVIDQAPGAGAERREGSTITIVVGRAREDRGSGDGGRDGGRDDNGGGADPPPEEPPPLVGP